MPGIPEFPCRRPGHAGVDEDLHLPVEV
jgi:hypothetical protein